MIYADVSWYQNAPKAGTYLPINWDKMRGQGVGGVYIKASQGLFMDRQFERNAKESDGVIDRGFYHFFDPSKDPVAQADYFKGVVEKYGGDYELSLMLDLEYSSRLGVAMKPGPFYLEQVNKFLDIVGDATIIYCNHSHVTTYLPRPSNTLPRYDLWARLGRHPLWIAQYSSDKRLTLAGPNVPIPWVDYYIWQCSADGNGLGKAYGVHSNSIDLNRVQA